MSDGFLGVRQRVIADVSADGHHLEAVRYRFPAGDEADYLEAWETHDAARPRVRLPISAVVHLMQNIGEWERYDIEAREERGQ